MALCAPCLAPGRIRADYAWQDKIQFNVINDCNYQGAYETVEGTYRWNPAR